MILLSSLALAQSVETVMPVITDLGAVIQGVEARGYQITDITIGIVVDDDKGRDVPVHVNEGDQVAFLGVGDPQRIANMDIFVYDEQGRVIAQDDLADNAPVVSFTADHSGWYTVRVIVSEAHSGYGAGFFSLTTAWYRSAEPVSVGETYDALVIAAEILEEDGYQVYHGEWETVPAKGYARVELPMPRADECIAVAVGTPSRTRKVDMAVGDPALNAVGSTDVDGNIALNTFVPQVAGTYTFLLEAKKLKRKQVDTHMMFIVGCKGI